MYQLLISKNVKKFLNKRDKKFLQRINETIKKLRENPYNHPQLDIKRLANTENDFRLRVGKFRFLYSVIESKIIIYVYRADSRGGIYKKNL